MQGAAMKQLVKETAREGDDAVVVAKTIRSCTESTRIFRSSVSVAQSLSGQFFYVLAILLILFIVHQLFVWVDQDPETAFDRGALLFEVAEVSWDTTGILWNSGIDICNAGVIPLWNAASFYVAEPTIVLVLEIFSLVFTRKHWNGLFSEDDFPYFGLDCSSSAEAAAWCGRYSFYEQRLESAEKAPYFVDQSQAYARRRLFDEYQANFTFDIRTARRLNELGGGDTAVMGSFDSFDLTTALDDFSNVFITLGPTIADVAFAVVNEILQTSFSTIADSLFTVLKSVMTVLKMLVKSGMLSTLINVGVDFVIIYFTEIAIPLLFAGIDFITCVIDFFRPGGWGEQLECGALASGS
tara:strand:- start:2314 stop:3375 length:1062 start_codon:yes stop_codon:yes gene_type:complete